MRYQDIIARSEGSQSGPSGQDGLNTPRALARPNSHESSLYSRLPLRLSHGERLSDSENFKAVYVLHFEHSFEREKAYFIPKSHP